MIGSKDIAARTLNQALEQAGAGLAVQIVPLNSLDGLIALRKGLCQVAGAHLLDAPGEYNIPFINRLFPDRSMKILTLAHRYQGLLVAPGNPRSIRNCSDLAREDVTFINRTPLYNSYCVQYMGDVPNQPGRPFLCPGH